jgi:hypothetical protein
LKYLSHCVNAGTEPWLGHSHCLPNLFVYGQDVEKGDKETMKLEARERSTDMLCGRTAHFKRLVHLVTTVLCSFKKKRILILLLYYYDSFAGLLLRTDLDLSYTQNLADEIM